jgi:hypothetical protein
VQEGGIAQEQTSPPVISSAYQLKWTRMDSNGLEWTRMDSNGLEWTRMDSNGLEWTRMDLFFPNSGALLLPKGLLSLSGSNSSANGFQESTRRSESIGKV